MTDTDRLRDLLEQAAPARPDVDPTSRAAAVARRGRTARIRDRALVGAAAVAVVAVAVAVPLTLGGGDGPDQATPAPVQVQPCPTGSVDTAILGPVPALGDVAAVRSCPAKDPAGDRLLPAEPLVGDAAQAFAEDVAALPAYELPSFCIVANVMPEPWALQVQTADGELLTLGSPMRVCSAVTIGGVDRGVDSLVAAFEGNLQRQVTFEPRDLECPTGKGLADGADTWNASFDPSTATGGVLCYRGDPMGATEYGETDGLLGDEGFSIVRDDLVAGLRPASDGGGCIDTGPQRLLVLTDDQGDRAAWIDDQCTGEFAGPGGHWTPSPAAEEAIAEALGGRVSR